MITLLVASGLAAVIIRGQSIKPDKKPLEEIPDKLRKFLSELNWYI